MAEWQYCKPIMPLKSKYVFLKKIETFKDLKRKVENVGVMFKDCHLFASAALNAFNASKSLFLLSSVHITQKIPTFNKNAEQGSISSTFYVQLLRS